MSRQRKATRWQQIAVRPSLSSDDVLVSVQPREHVTWSHLGSGLFSVSLTLLSFQLDFFFKIYVPPLPFRSCWTNSRVKPNPDQTLTSSYVYICFNPCHTCFSYHRTLIRWFDTNWFSDRLTLTSDFNDPHQKATFYAPSASCDRDFGPWQTSAWVKPFFFRPHWGITCHHWAVQSSREVKALPPSYHTGRPRTSHSGAILGLVAMRV